MNTEEEEKSKIATYYALDSFVSFWAPFVDFTVVVDILALSVAFIFSIAKFV